MKLRNLFKKHNDQTDTVRRVYYRIAQSKIGSIPYHIIKHYVCSANRLETLVVAKSDNWYVRMCVAEFTMFDEVLDLLSLDESAVVRIKVARRERHAHLDRFAHDSDEQVRLVVAQNTRLYDDILCEDSDIDVKLAVTNNTDSEYAISKLIVDDDIRIKFAIINRKRLVEIMSLMRDPDWRVQDYAREMYEQICPVGYYN